MHALGIVLIWTALQVTVICLILLIVLRLARNSEPYWRGKLILAGIVASLIISAFALSPWPSWTGSWRAAQSPVAASVNSTGDNMTEAVSNIKTDSSQSTAAVGSVSSNTTEV